MDVANFHALLEPVGNSPLACSCGLGEGNGATEGASSSAISYTGNADIVDTGDSGVAGHASGHLDLHVEFGAGGERKALNTEAGNVLGNCSRLERRLLRATGGAIDIGSEGTSAILVDLRACVSCLRFKSQIQNWQFT